MGSLLLIGDSREEVDLILQAWEIDLDNQLF